MTTLEELLEEFETIDEAIAELEAALEPGAAGAAPTLDESLPVCMDLTRQLLVAFGRHHGKPMPVDEPDLLAVLKAFVKGDPSLNAVRDNVRELVYYRNCIDMDRRDALPGAAERTAVRTVRHIYLYLRTRLIQEERRGEQPIKPM
ncbi:MAG: hypothetical protein P8009_07035 [Gammaproteobacteria bacterium]